MEMLFDINMSSNKLVGGTSRAWGTLYSEKATFKANPSIIQVNNQVTNFSGRQVERWGALLAAVFIIAKNIIAREL